MDTRHEQIRAEAAAVGCEIGLISGALVEVAKGNRAVVNLVVAAHGKAIDSTEGQALKDKLQSDARWDEYVSLVTQREMPDKETMLADLMDILSQAVTSDTGSGLLLAVPKDKWEAWKAARSNIKSMVAK